MENPYARRVEAIREMMREHGWDAVILTGGDPHGSEYPADRWKQVEWVSGFTGEAGDLVITLDHAGLWTDTRYFIQALRQLEGTGIELHKLRVPEAVPIPRWLAGYDYPSAQDDACVSVVVDGLCHSVDAVNALEDAFAEAGIRGIRVIDIPDLLSPLWRERPELPVSPILTLGEELTGESRESKLQWLRRFLLKKGCDAMLVTALDEIAWLLNVRGSDIAYNPLVLSYLLVTLDKAFWFVKKSPAVPDAETRDSFYELQADGVEIREYRNDLELMLSGLVASDPVDRLYVDPSTLNHYLFSQIPYPLETGPSPIPLRKAVKTAAEIEGMREAHLEDGVAMEKFLFWLERQLALGDPVSERAAADRLDSLRAAIPGYRGNSFDTISAYGENAALPHYVTPVSGGAILRPHGLYLVDSGGQYLFGTTDLTRTVPLGPCSSLEKEDYTLVLKGHIQLAKAVFPAGTAGCQLDVLARNALWSSKRNFGHGTGHGVGSYLCVHEGPQDIRQNFNPQPLLPGMVTSDEPGIYREGMHGIRHENLLLCCDAGTNDFGSWRSFETLTLCHIDTSALLPQLLTADEKAWLNAYNERVFQTLSPLLPEEITCWLRDKTRPLLP